MKIGTIDLRILLTPSLIEPAKKWVATFIERYPVTSYRPFVDEQNRTLNICSFAFPGLMGYVDVKDSTEFEVRRLRKLGEDGIHRLMARKRDELLVRNFEQTLESLRRTKIGEYVGMRPDTPQNKNLEYAF